MPCSDSALLVGTEDKARKGAKSSLSFVARGTKHSCAFSPAKEELSETDPAREQSMQQDEQSGVSF